MNPKSLLKAWPVLIVIALLLSPFIHSSFRTASGFAYLGTIYQVLGIVTVILGIDDRIKHFRGTSIWGSILIWFKETFPIFLKPIVGNLHGSSIGSTSAFGRGMVTQTIDHLPIPEQIAWLQNKIYETQKMMGEMDDRIQLELKTIKQRLTNLDASISTKIYEFNSKLGMVLTGSFKVEILGAVCLIIGVVFGTLPGRMSDLY